MYEKIDKNKYTPMMRQYLEIKENYPDSEVVIYEKNNNVSFLSCGIALNVGKVIDTTEKLFYSSP